MVRSTECSRTEAGPTGVRARGSLSDVQLEPVPGLEWSLATEAHPPTEQQAVSPAALRRRLPEDVKWALPAYARYDAEVRPAELADVVVRMDNPEHPALREG